MRIAFYTNNISPHQLPLAHAVARRVGYENFLYVGDAIAWRGTVVDAGAIAARTRAEAGDELETCDVLYTCQRDLDLLERRAKRGLATFHYSERWFKPMGILPGWLRMLVPGYRRMAKRFVVWANGDPGAKVLAVGPWAKKDFLRIGVKAEKIVDWGYFVAPSERELKSEVEVEQRILASSLQLGPGTSTRTLKVLWVGRSGVGWKREGDIARAVAIANARHAKAGGDGRAFSFTKMSGASLEEVRRTMREHDIYVLSSAGEEGWGAALSEALEEGMRALGTFEAGASAAMLPKERLYHAGDVKALAGLLEREARGELPPCSIGVWTAEKAAERLVDLI